MLRGVRAEAPCGSAALQGSLMTDQWNGIRGRLIERALSAGDLALVMAYTGLVRGRCRRWGKGATIRPIAVIREPSGVVVGKGVTIREGLWLNNANGRDDGEPTVVIGDEAYIGRGVHINAKREVVIESGVLIADHVYIGDDSHVFKDRSRTISSQGTVFRGAVRIGSGAWLGHGVVVLPGVRIGRNAIVGANAVVTRDVPDYAIAAGVPAQIVRANPEGSRE